MIKLKKLKYDEEGNVKMVGAVVGLFVTLAVVILVFYNIAASLDADTLDQDWKAKTGTSATATPVNNATNGTLDQAATFFTIAPIIGIVIVAVVILGYVNRIGGGGG